MITGVEEGDRESGKNGSEARQLREADVAASHSETSSLSSTHSSHFPVSGLLSKSSKPDVDGKEDETLTQAAFERNGQHRDRVSPNRYRSQDVLSYASKLKEKSGHDAAPHTSSWDHERENMPAQAAMNAPRDRSSSSTSSTRPGQSSSGVPATADAGPAGPGDGITAYQYAAVQQITENRANIEYILTIREQPKHSRMCGVGEKADRRPIDPAPIIQLRVVTHDSPEPKKKSTRLDAGRSDERKPEVTEVRPLQEARSGIVNTTLDRSGKDVVLRRGVPVSTEWGEGWEDKTWYLENPYYFMYAMLADAETDEELHLLGDGRTRYTTGSCVSCLYHLKDIDGSEQGFFVFPDLSIRVEGRYRLKLCLFETIGHEVHHCKSVYSTPFNVYTAKRFPGMEESTLLSKSFADQGLKVRVRKNPRARRQRGAAGAGKRKGTLQSDDESDGEAEMLASQQSRPHSPIFKRPRHYLKPGEHPSAMYDHGPDPLGNGERESLDAQRRRDEHRAIESQYRMPPVSREDRMYESGPLEHSYPLKDGPPARQQIVPTMQYAEQHPSRDGIPPSYVPAYSKYEQHGSVPPPLPSLHRKYPPVPPEPVRQQYLPSSGRAHRDEIYRDEHGREYRLVPTSREEHYDTAMAHARHRAQEEYARHYEEPPSTALRMRGQTMYERGQPIIREEDPRYVSRSTMPAPIHAMTAREHAMQLQEPRQPSLARPTSPGRFHDLRDRAVSDPYGGPVMHAPSRSGPLYASSRPEDAHLDPRVSSRLPPMHVALAAEQDGAHRPLSGPHRLVPPPSSAGRHPDSPEMVYRHHPANIPPQQPIAYPSHRELDRHPSAQYEYGGPRQAPRQHMPPSPSAHQASQMQQHHHQPPGFSPPSLPQDRSQHYLPAPQGSARLPPPPSAASARLPMPTRHTSNPHPQQSQYGTYGRRG